MQPHIGKLAATTKPQPRRKRSGQHLSTPLCAHALAKALQRRFRLHAQLVCQRTNLQARLRQSLLCLGGLTFEQQHR